MSVLWLALCGLVVMTVVIICAACYVSGSIEALERQAELMARMMRVETEAEDVE